MTATTEDVTGLPLTPYAGTSGYSGSDTSEERARQQDADGTTSERQRRTRSVIAATGGAGCTWKELSDVTGWHHGESSGALSVMHKEGVLARLTERRNRCAVYVLPEHVNGRETALHGRRRAEPAEVIPADLDAILHEWLDRGPDGYSKAGSDPRGLRDALRAHTGYGAVPTA